MKLTKIGKSHDIFISDSFRDNENPKTLLIEEKKYFRFMDCFYIPEKTYRLDCEFVTELCDIREEIAENVIDYEYNNRVIQTCLNELNNITNINNKSILDFGCGTGYGGKIIKEKYNSSNIIGFDIRCPRIFTFKDFYAKFIYQSPTKPIPLENNEIDIITSFFVFHFNVTDYQIRELKRILKPNGILVFNLIKSASLEILKRLEENGFKMYQEREEYFHQKYLKCYLYNTK